MRFVLCVLSLVLSVSGCSLADYSPNTLEVLSSPDKVDYRNIQESERRYQVVAAVENVVEGKRDARNEHKPEYLAIKGALFRAAELALKNGFTAFSLEGVEDRSLVSPLNNDDVQTYRYMLSVRMIRKGEFVSERDYQAVQVIKMNNPEQLMQRQYAYSPFYEAELLKQCESGKRSFVGRASRCACKVANLGAVLPEVATKMYLFPGEQRSSEKTAVVNGVIRQLEYHCSFPSPKAMTYRGKLPLWLKNPELHAKFNRRVLPN